MFIRIFAPGALVVSLAACSGGGTSNMVDPVVASGPPPATLGDVAGMTFPFRTAYAEMDGGVYDLARQTFALEIVSDTEMNLTTADGVVALTENGFGEFEGTLNGVSYSLESQGLGYAYSDGWVLSFSDGMGLMGGAVGYFGLEAPQSRMDELQAMSAVAGYSGTSTIIANNGGVVNNDTGLANLLVDFGSGAVTGQVHSTADIDFNLVGGSITGAGIEGTISLSGPDSAGYVLNSSGVEGQFFGMDALELHGTFEGEGTGPMGAVEVIGAFSTID